VLVYQKIAEERIRQAQAQGEFDRLPGMGKPLVLEDDSREPEDLRLAYRILKNADCLPPELQLRKEIRQMEDLLSGIPDEREQYRQLKRINFKIMQLNMLGRGSPLFEEDQIYYPRLAEKFGSR
jgi:hypothetical protein